VPPTLDKHLSELDEILLATDELLSPDSKSPTKKHVGSANEDSFDFENSDELNKIISKYEQMMDTKQ
jgi:hypothetical protein